MSDGDIIGAFTTFLTTFMANTATAMVASSQFGSHRTRSESLYKLVTSINSHAKT